MDGKTLVKILKEEFRKEKRLAKLIKKWNKIKTEFKTT